MKLRSIGVALTLCTLAASAAHAAQVKYAATLKGADEVPANTTTGKGDVAATLDPGAMMLTYTVTYSGLTGPATAAHFHAPAAPGANAPPVITMTSLTSPIKGTTKLTSAQIADLSAGKWYFNVHTAAHPAGEIRGQLVKAK